MNDVVWYKSIDTVLFDLDGTLLDTVPDIAFSLMQVMTEDGIVAPGLADVRRMIGDGVGKLVERAYAWAGAPLIGRASEGRIATMKRLYSERLHVETRLMPCADAVISRLAASNIRMAVVTNKPDLMAKQLITHFGWDRHIAVVQGADPAYRLKPAPDLLLAAMGALGSSLQRTVMVGDGENDLLSARAAGMAAILVRGGYGAVTPDSIANPDAGDRVISGLAELPQLLAEAETVS